MRSALHYSHRLALGIFFSVLLLWGGAMIFLMRQSALPPQASGTMIVVFPPGIADDQAFLSVIAAEAYPIRSTAFSFIWVVKGDEGVVGKLKAQGALGVYRELPINPSIAGCFGYAEAQIASYTGP